LVRIRRLFFLSEKREMEFAGTHLSYERNPPKGKKGIEEFLSKRE